MACALAALPAAAADRELESLRELVRGQAQQIKQLSQRLERVEGQTGETRQQLDVTEERLDAAGAAIDSVRERKAAPSWTDRVTLGGYGSARFEASDLEAQNDTFTYRRFVLALDGQVNNRLRTYLELELERFAELELEKALAIEDDEIEVEQALEGTSASEIALEQAWARYQVNPAFNVDLGALLVPLGRFNINHDDDQWNLPRRSLADKGVPVLPAAAAWTELGVGFSGERATGLGLIDYKLYVVNGAQLDFEVEEEIKGATGESETKLEAEFGPQQGTFSRDLNDGKAVTGRLALRPRSGHELALSGYVGRYTPQALTDQNVWSVGFDGFHQLGGLELEYQVVHTEWEGVDDVARDFAARAFNQELAIGQGAAPNAAKHEIEVTLGGDSLADARTGYWMELRYPFWPAALDASVLGRSFEGSSLEPTLRFEQVFFDDQLAGFEFDDGVVTELDTRDDARLSRATLGFAYRPIPGWVFTLAGEYTWTDQDSLAGLTNFLAAQDDEDNAFSLLLGTAFSF